MNQADKNRMVWTLLLLISYVGLSYSPRFSFLGTLMILLFGYLAWKRKSIEYLGLRLNSKQLLISALLAGVTIAISHFIVKSICASSFVIMSPPVLSSVPHIFFYTVNEEIVLGALMIRGLRHSGGKLRDIYISLILATAFSLLHFLFYGWIASERGAISILALTSLFMVGVIRNNLILTTGHIGYSWAVHFGFVFVMLGSPKTWGGRFLTEPEIINLVFGTTSFILALVALAILTSLPLVFSRRHSSN